MHTLKYNMSKYKIKKGFIVQKLGDKLTIFDGEKSMLYTFNQTAGLVFQLLKKGKTVQEIVDTFVKKYKITPKRAKIDVKDVLHDLISKKVVVHSNAVSDKKPKQSKKLQQDHRKSKISREKVVAKGKK